MHFLGSLETENMETTSTHTTDYITDYVVANGTTNQTMDAPSNDDVIAKHLRIILLPIIVLCGTIGNGLSIVVLLRPRMRTTSVYFYLVVLSCSDSVVLLFSALKTWVFEISGAELFHVSVAMCKSVVFILLVGWYASSWLIVLLTVDRFAVVCSPLHATSLCTVRKARILCVGLISFIILCNLHVFWTFTIFTTASGRLQCSGDQSLKFMGYPFEVFKLASYCFLPFTIVIVLNCAIIFQIRRTRRHFAEQSSRHMGGQCSNALNPVHTKVTYMLLTVSFTWFLMTLPFTLVGFLRVTNKIGTTIIFLLMYTNHSVNFFLYCLTGRKFRRELKLFIKGACRRRKHVRKVPSKITFRSELGRLDNVSVTGVVKTSTSTSGTVRSLNNAIMMENLKPGLQ